MPSHAEYQRQWAAKNKAKVRAYDKRYRDLHRDEINKRKRERWASDPDNLETNRRYGARPEVKARRRETTYLRVYGVSVAEVEQLLASQNNACAVCSTPLVLVQHRKNTAHIDHCHKSGQVRGLLCNKCNRGIGLLKDDVALLRAAVSYLTKTGPLRLVSDR